MIRTTLRGIAVTIALGAIVDPVLAIRRVAPLPVDVRPAGGESINAAATADAVSAVKLQLASHLGTDVALDSDARPSSAVLVGDRTDPEAVPADMPVSTVTTAASESEAIRIVNTRNPDPVLPGWSAAIEAEIEGTGLAGRTSEITLEQNGLELQRTQHRWTADVERYVARLYFTAPVQGLWPMQVRVKSGEAGRPAVEHTVDVRVIAEARTLRVAAWESRPSWTSAFVRRALEEDPTFDVSTIVRASRGQEVRTGQAPATLSERTLAPFDLVLIGAPEDLTEDEILGLETFARRRGGAVVFLPDRRPAGRYINLLTRGGFDEILVDKPLQLVAGGARLRASELVLPRAVGPELSALASVQHDDSTRPAIVSTPMGAGRIMFSGALDAWRFRAEEDDAFARFWRTQLGVAAAAAPRRLDISARPAVAAAGSAVELRVNVRATELTRDAARTSVPPVSAEVIGADGSKELVRLWPSAVTGVYEGRFVPSAVGKFDVRAHMDRTTADTVVLVSPRAPASSSARDDSLRLVARATGGVAVTAGDLRPLEDHLRSLPRPSVVENTLPMRSAWWMALFIVLLCSEWTFRRRAGLR